MSHDRRQRCLLKGDREPRAQTAQPWGPVTRGSADMDKEPRPRCGAAIQLKNRGSEGKSDGFWGPFLGFAISRWPAGPWTRVPVESPIKGRDVVPW